MPYLVEASGSYALFTRPELASERVSYDVITPSAARGLIEAIFWHPGLFWRVERIYVLRPIRFISVRRNEVTEKLNASNMLTAMNGKPKDNYLATSDCIAQRASLILKDVHYVIRTRFDMTERASPSDNHGKFSDIFRRRLEGGKNFHHPYLGTREFPARVGPWQGGEEEAARLAREANPGLRDMGLILYDLDYSDRQNITPMYFRARLLDGMLAVEGEEVYR